MAFVLWLVFILAGRTLRQIAIGQITELTNAKVEAKSVDFKLDGSVFIEKLVIRPYQEQKYDDAILKAETVYARFGKVSLLLLRPRLKEISVNDFVFDAQYDFDTGRWNVGALKIKSAGGPGKMPLVHLKRGRVQYSKVSGGQREVAAAVPLDARFWPGEEARDGYSFSITTAERAESGKSTLTGFWQPGRITIAGGISSADVPAFERSWTINVLAAELNYDQRSTYSLKLRIKDLVSTHIPTQDTFGSIKPAFLKKTSPFTALQRFFNRYHPAGRVDIDLEASGNLQQPAESTLFGKVYCKDVSILDRKLPYAIEHIAGQIDLTENSAVLKNLCGRHGEVEVTLNGWSKDFGPNWRYQIQITSDNMALDDDLYNALSTRQKKFWSSFSPGGLAAINYCLARRSATDKKRILAVKLLDAEAVYQKFPYPLKNLTGELFFDRESIKISQLVSQYNGRQIILNGKVTERNTDRPIYDISIEANNIPLDSTLAASLSNRQRYLYNRFNMAGLADAEVKVFTSEDDFGPADFIANVSLKEASLKADDFPLPLSDVSAKTVITPDLVRVENLIGRHDHSSLSLTGRIWMGTEGEQSRYQLSIDAKQAQLSDDLFNLLPPSLGKAVSKLQPEGNINYHADLKKSAAAQSPDYNITVDCLGDSIKLEPFTYPLKDIIGKLTITKNSLKLRDITATIADNTRTAPEASMIKINGEVALADSPPGQDRLQITSGDITFIADNLRIKGKFLTNLKTDVYYDPHRQTWLSKNLIADSYNGRLTGKLELKQSAEGAFEYLLQTGFDDIDLKQFLSDPERQQISPEGYTTGKMDGSLSVSGRIGDDYSRTGRCRLSIRDMQAGKLSPLAKLLSVLNLTEPKDFAFERMLVDSYIKRNRLFFKQLDLSGEAIAFNGSGWMDLESQNVDLILTARGRRLATAEPSVFQSLTDALGTGVVRMEVTGNVYDPQVETTTLPVIKDTLEILGTPR